MEFKQYIITNKAELKEFMNVTDANLTNICLTARVPMDLMVLKNFPNARKLTLDGKFTGFENIVTLESLEILEIRLEAFEYADLEKLMTSGLKHLEIHDMRKLNDLSFIEKAENLERLYLENLPGVKVFPNFQKIYSLKLYELHKLENLEALKTSAIRYLDLTLSADKISATEIANILMEMEKLEKVNFYYVDRNCRRTGAIENRLVKCGRENLIAEKGMFDYVNWAKL